ncbi:hypothetical protein Scep_007761 [Stephania cephalantha]|uniref:Uncharacterized protein n=1 Tax=Stephania cephalantha TaxID=152367 RepID=A0AAP0PNJ5_9MAGN
MKSLSQTLNLCRRRDCGATGRRSLLVAAAGDWSLRNPKPSPLFAAPQAVAAASQLYFRGQTYLVGGMEELMARGMHSLDQRFGINSTPCDEFRESVSRYY